MVAPTEVIDWFSGNSSPLIVRRNTIMRTQPGRLLFVASGSLQVNFTIDDGHAARRIATLVFEDEILDLMALGNLPRTIRAIGGDARCFVSLDEHVAKSHNKPDLLALASLVAGRLVRQAISSTFSLEARLCTVLVKLGARYGVRKGSGVEFDIPMSRDAMAVLMGVRPESLSRAITHAKASGLIKLTGRAHVTVPDWQALCALSPIAGLVVSANQCTH